MNKGVAIPSGLELHWRLSNWKEEQDHKPYFNFFVMVVNTELVPLLYFSHINPNIESVLKK